MRGPAEAGPINEGKTMTASSGRYTKRTIGSQPTRKDSPKETDPETEAMRETLKGNPFRKKYHGKEFGE
jgi:hypothetical protein